MNTRLLAIAIGMAAAQLVAQRGDVPPDPGPAAVRFELAQDGHVNVIPYPGSTDADSRYPFGDVSVVYRAVRDDAAAPWWQLLFLGGSDLTDAVDAVRFFERLEEFDGARLLARLRQREVPEGIDLRALALQRRLAVHALADLGFKPALGRLDELAADGTIDAPLRRAVENAVTTLRGSPRPEPVPSAALKPLLDSLVDAPADHDALIVVDRWRMPCARSLLAAVRTAQGAQYLAKGRRAGGELTAGEWSTTYALQERLGLVAYEIARRYGDQRIDRAVLALRFDSTLNRTTRTWLALEGVFDVEAIRAGSRSAPEELRFALDHGIAVTIDATRAVITNVPTGEPRLGHDAARALVATLPDAPLRGVLRRLPWEDAVAFPPSSFGLTLHPGGETAASIVVRAADHTALRAWLSRHAHGPQFATLVRSLRLAASEQELRITIPRGAVDPAALLLELGLRR